MKTEMILRRQSREHTSKQVTGRLEVHHGGNKVFECYTLELPWKNNERQVSCIFPAPGGQYIYKVRKTKKSPSFNYEHLDILDTPGRDFVKVHSGNYNTQIRGCVLPGEKLTDINGDGERDVTNSRKTLEKLLGFLPDTCELTIRWD